MHYIQNFQGIFRESSITAAYRRILTHIDNFIWAMQKAREKEAARIIASNLRDKE